MDRYGPRRVIFLGALVVSSGLLLAVLIVTPGHLYLTLGLLVGGGSVAFGYTAHALFLPNWFIRRRGLAMGLAFSGVGVGSIILLPWIERMVLAAGWRSACLVMALLVLVLGLLNRLQRLRPEDMGSAPDGDRTADLRPRSDPSTSIVAVASARSTRRDPGLVADEPPAAAAQDRREADPARPLLHLAARGKLLDGVSLSADARAHGAARVASDMIGRTVRRCVEPRERACPHGRCSRAALPRRRRDQGVGPATTSRITGCAWAGPAVRLILLPVTRGDVDEDGVKSEIPAKSSGPLTST